MVWCSCYLPTSQLKVDAGWRQVTSWANGVDRKSDITSLCGILNRSLIICVPSSASFSPKERRRRVRREFRIEARVGYHFPGVYSIAQAEKFFVHATLPLLYSIIISMNELIDVSSER
jgi:hypothetical protein